MAQVDFSTAVLEPAPGTKPMDYSSYMRIYYSSGIWNAPNGAVIVANNGQYKLVENQNKVTVVYTGTFTASGTEFYIGYFSNGIKLWKVTNISFNSGDTYSFAIDIETSITA